MLEASKETEKFGIFKTDSLSMNIGMVLNKEFVAIEIANDHCYDQEVFCEPKGNWDDCFSFHEVEFAAQLEKDSMDELLNERRQSFEVVIEMEDQDLILMKNEGILSQRGNLMNLINFIDEEQMQENINEDDETRITLGEEI